MNDSAIEQLLTSFDIEARRETSPEEWHQPARLPAGRYIDPAFYRLELEALKGSWLFAIHGDEVAQPGDFKRWQQLGQNLFFSRGDDGRVRCFRNSCRHRSSSVVIEEEGRRRRFVCPVHGWAYDRDGRLSAVPERRDMPGLCPKERGLIEVRCENLGELYFINFDDNAVPLLEDFGPLAPVWQQYRPDQSRLVRRVSMVENVNYKLLQEANMEVYHVRTVHPEVVNALLDPGVAPLECFDRGQSVQRMRLKKKDFTESEINLPIAEESAEVSAMAQVSFLCYPNRVSAMNAWGYPLMSYWPLAVDKTLVDICWIAPRSDQFPGLSAEGSDPMWDEIIGTFNRVLQEDFVLCGDMQLNLQSGAVAENLIGYQERAIYSAHMELDRRIGLDRIPEALRVEPRRL